MIEVGGKDICLEDLGTIEKQRDGCSVGEVSDVVPTIPLLQFQSINRETQHFPDQKLNSPIFPCRPSHIGLHLHFLMF